MDQGPIPQEHPLLSKVVVLPHQHETWSTQETTRGKMANLPLLSRKNCSAKEAFKKPGYLLRLHPKFVRLVWQKNIRNKEVWRWKSTNNTFTRLPRLALSFIYSPLPGSKQPQYWVHWLYDIGGSITRNSAPILTCSNIYWSMVYFRFPQACLVVSRL